MLDFPSLLYKGLRILMFQLSGVYCSLNHRLLLRFRITRCVYAAEAAGSAFKVSRL